MSYKSRSIPLSNQYLKLTNLSMSHLSTLNELSATLLNQVFQKNEDEKDNLEQYLNKIKVLVELDQSLAVLSNYQENCSYIFSGDFGKLFGVTTPFAKIDSAFEDEIFSKIYSDDLLERHVLELRFFQFQKQIPLAERRKYFTLCNLRLAIDDHYIYITHRTIYVESMTNGSVFLSLCLYNPSSDQQSKKGIEGRIINNETGKMIPISEYQCYDKDLLGARELEVLKEIALGKKSKQIADELCLSPYTIYRHRQNILKKLNVSNSSEAVKVAVFAGLIVL